MLEKLLRAAQPFYHKARPHALFKNPPEAIPEAANDWIKFASVEAPGKAHAKAARFDEAARILPTVIQFDPKTGKPLSEQCVRLSGPETAPQIITIPWREWCEGAVAQTFDREASDIPSTTMVLRSLHCKGKASMGLQVRLAPSHIHTHTPHTGQNIGELAL